MFFTFFFSFSLFLSAFLLFSLEPMLGKHILPLMGGTPKIWTACTVFYQTLMLLGYGYAHLLATRFPVKKQVVFHTSLVILSLLALTIFFRNQGGETPSADNPIFGLFIYLIRKAGVPFFLLSATAPLLQNWFSRLKGKESKNPYVLYAASNLGSFTALMAYPFAIEPGLRLNTQFLSLSVGYGLFALLIAAGGLLTVKYGEKEAAARKTNKTQKENIPLKTCLYWLLLAFLPSSLMLSLTSFLTLDIAPVPLLWIGPLALYLLSFVIVFSRTGPRFLDASKISQIMCIFLMLPLLLMKTKNFQMIILHLLFFFFTAWVCHGELARTKPKPAKLTVFYLIMSAGGMLGGLFNLLIAPLLFASLAEYPLFMLLALLIPAGGIKSVRCDREKKILYRLVIPVLIVVSVGGFIASEYLSSQNEKVLIAGRNFFGTYAVVEEKKGTEYFKVLRHGSTVHGMQGLTFGKESEPLSYYRKTGPLGNIFAVFDGQNDAWNIGVIGMGTATTSAYAKPSQTWTYYEIDRDIAELSTQHGIFTYYKTFTPDARIAVGDARQILKNERRAKPYDMMILDAFTSDSIPAHLLTKEAMSLYMERLSENGLLVIHVSNRYLSVDCVVKNVADALGLPLLRWSDKAGKGNIYYSDATWLVVAKDADILAPVSLQEGKTGWGWVKTSPDIGVWTDDFYNIWKIFKLNSKKKC